MTDHASPVHGPTVVGEPAIERLMRSLDYRLQPDTRPLTPDQVAVVLHALADHTAIQAALRYRRDEDSPWPEAQSVGRWFHDVADQAERLAHEPSEPTGTIDPEAPWQGWRDLQRRCLAAAPNRPTAACPACGEMVAQAVVVFHMDQEHADIAASIRTAGGAGRV